MNGSPSPTRGMAILQGGIDLQGNYKGGIMNRKSPGVCSYSIRMEPKYVKRRQDAEFWDDDEYLDAFGRYILINGSVVLPTWENLVDTLERRLDGDTKRAVALARMIGKDGEPFTLYHEDVARLIGLNDVDFEISAMYPDDDGQKSYSAKPRRRC